MKICYIEKSFAAKSVKVIDLCNGIIAEYTKQGYSLTLRQLYYQLVARGHIGNRTTEYKRLGSIVNDARLAGLIDWDAIEDRTRNVKTIASWTSPQEIVDACADSFAYDHWADQPCHVEVWVEKEALAGVIDRAATRLDVPHLSCRGYMSQSEQHAAGRRFFYCVEEK